MVVISISGCGILCESLLPARRNTHFDILHKALNKKDDRLDIKKFVCCPVKENFHF